jgi:hypothetical protein
MLEAWEAAQVGRSSWEEGHGMVWPENIDSGYSNFQLDTRSSGSRRNLDYLLSRRTLKEWGRMSR